MTVYKTIKTIGDAELYLKEKFNFVYDGSISKNDEKLFDELLDIILKKENQYFF